MKKLMSAFIPAILFTLIANAQILNPGFESWTSGNPNNWSTTNIPIAGFINVTQTTDKHSGSSALRGEVASFQGTLLPPLLQSGSSGNGFAISQRYTVFELYYKFTPVSGDQFVANVSLKQSGSIIAQGAMALGTALSTYTKLDVPLTYTGAGVPDTAFIQILILGPTGNDYHAASVMFVDDVSFTYSTGIENTLVSDLSEKSYPNPSNVSVFIPLNGAKSGNIEVYDLYGKKINTTAFESSFAGEQYINLSVAEFSSGIYYYVVRDDNFNRKGKFIVRH
jgi:hypothetical protein